MAELKEQRQEIAKLKVRLQPPCRHPTYYEQTSRDIQRLRKELQTQLKTGKDPELAAERFRGVKREREESLAAREREKNRKTATRRQRERDGGIITIDDDEA
jgi:hypothetical protein